MDQQNFPQTPIVPAPFGLQAEVILRLHVLKLDAHLEAAAEKRLLRVLEAHELPGLSLGECMRSNLAAQLP